MILIYCVLTIGLVLLFGGGTAGIAHLWHHLKSWWCEVMHSSSGESGMFTVSFPLGDEFNMFVTKWKCLDCKREWIDANISENIQDS